MSDSTRAVSAPPAPLPALAPRTHEEDAADDPVCIDLGRMAERDIPGLITRLLHGHPDSGEQFDALDPAMALLIHETLQGLHRLVIRRRQVRKWELLVFRFVGARCAHAGLDLDLATSAVNGTTEALMDAILGRCRQLDDVWGPLNVEAATAKFCGLFERFAARASRQVEKGYEVLVNGVAPLPERVVGPFVRAIDGRASGAECRDADNDLAPGELVLLVATGHREDAPALATAAREIEVHVPGTFDLGLGDTGPTHRRLFVPIAPDFKTWCQVSDLLSYVASANGVVAVTRQCVRDASALRACYVEMAAELPEITADRGQRSSVLMTGTRPKPDPTEPTTPQTVRVAA